MFSGQSEEQARRKILAVLLDETRKVLESARELTNVYKFVTEGKKKEIELSIIKISKAEDEIEKFLLKRGNYKCWLYSVSWCFNWR